MAQVVLNQQEQQLLQITANKYPEQRELLTKVLDSQKITSDRRNLNQLYLNQKEIQEIKTFSNSLSGTHYHQQKRILMRLSTIGCFNPNDLLKKQRAKRELIFNQAAEDYTMQVKKEVAANNPQPIFIHPGLKAMNIVQIADVGIYSNYLNKFL